MAALFQNSTLIQQVSTSSVTIGSTPLNVSNFVPTLAFYSQFGDTSGYHVAVGIGVAHGATLYVPISVVEIGESTPNNSSSWEQITMTLTGITVA